MKTIEKYSLGCGKQDGFKRKCGNVFETWKDGATGKIEQEVRYYCPSCQSIIKALNEQKEEVLEIIDESDIELKGKCIDAFERVSKIKEIILLGEDGEIRRIILK